MPPDAGAQPGELSPADSPGPHELLRYRSAQGRWVVAGSALVPVTVVTLLLSGTSGRLAQRIGPWPPLVARCLLCTVASILAVRIGPDVGYWTAVLPVALLFGLGLASLIPPLTASAVNSAPDSLAGLASGVNNAVARVAGLLWIAALPPITGLTGAAYTDPIQFRSSFAQTLTQNRRRSQAVNATPRLVPDLVASTGVFVEGGR
ncbi:MAG TPA: MFS transporter [Streptosporangiaceae bacterium]|nr:MFS transporter [Streptosporangiaceae bacterium]